MTYYKKPQSVVRYDENGNLYLELLPITATPDKNYTDYSGISMIPVDNTPLQKLKFKLEFNKKRAEASKTLFELGTFPASLNPLAGTIMGGVYGGLAAKDAYENGLNWNNGIQLGLSLPLVGRGLYTGFNKGTLLTGKYIPKSLIGRWSRAYLINNSMQKSLSNPTLGEINDVSPIVSPTPSFYSKPSSLAFYQRPEARISSSERLGIPKGDRNNVHSWHVAAYPGYQLKVLMKGSPLEKALSKNGQVNINSINAAIKNASKLEKEIINKVLQEKFAGQTKIDYNQLKKAVLDELIGSYNRVPLTEWADYGMKGLGFEDIEQVSLFSPDYQLNTFTFESPRIPYGNTKHYGGNPLGHSRTYTLPEDPHILYVMESQSDWALQALRKKTSIDAQSAYERASLAAVNHLQEIAQMKANLEKGLAPDGHKIQYEWEQRDIEEIIKNTEKLLASNNARAARFDAILHPEKYVLENHLKQNYLQRQLQENLRYAAENGQTKMRYPTRETAIKIEGYRPVDRYGDEYNKLLAEYHDLNIKIFNLNAEYIHNRVYPLSQSDYRKLLNKRSDIKVLLELAKKDAKLVYSPEHETILKKYSDFPKLFRKLYKNAEVRTATDAKGNTWYEVDVPKGYLNREWLFNKGGQLNYYIKTKKSSSNK